VTTSLESPGRFTDHNVIVTGAGQGIGQAIARQFAADGADVMLVGRTLAPLQAEAAQIQASGGKAWAFAADVSKMHDVENAIAAAADRWGRIDVLVNNAGIDDDTPFLEITEAGWNAVIGTNLTGAFFMSQQVCREMAGSGGGVVIHIASIDAFGGDGSFASYNSAKAGLLGLNRTMALELAQHGIRVNTVSPGFTHTAMTERAVAPEVMGYLLHDFARVPMRRLVRTDEVASAVLYLSSPEASGITGTNLTVDCGLTANWYVLETIPSVAPSPETVAESP
jgi:meso-butanediol dehydrogenase/(S,S)-butanediol dehydrogenase/diacetyl reductase